MSLPSPKELQIKVHAEEITPSATPTPTQQETQDWEAFKKAAVLISKIYNYPANVVIAQCALESKHGTSEFARERNNYCGIGAVDDDPNQAYRFENQEQMLIYYMNMIKNNFGDTWDYRDNAETLLYKLENNSAGVVYASDPRYVSKVMNQQEWRQY